jgi:hypothetical protein
MKKKTWIILGCDFCLCIMLVLSAFAGVYNVKASPQSEVTWVGSPTAVTWGTPTGISTIGTPAGLPCTQTPAGTITSLFNYPTFSFPTSGLGTANPTENMNTPATMVFTPTSSSGSFTVDTCERGTCTSIMGGKGVRFVPEARNQGDRVWRRMYLSRPSGWVGQALVVELVGNITITGISGQQRGSVDWNFATVNSGSQIRYDIFNTHGSHSFALFTNDTLDGSWQVRLDSYYDSMYGETNISESWYADIYMGYLYEPTSTPVPYGTPTLAPCVSGGGYTGFDPIATIPEIVYSYGGCSSILPGFTIPLAGFLGLPDITMPAFSLCVMWVTLQATFLNLSLDFLLSAFIVMGLGFALFNEFRS